MLDTAQTGQKHQADTAQACVLKMGNGSNSEDGKQEICSNDWTFLSKPLASQKPGYHPVTTCRMQTRRLAIWKTMLDRLAEVVTAEEKAETRRIVEETDPALREARKSECLVALLVKHAITTQDHLNATFPRETSPLRMKSDQTRVKITGCRK